jgi:hypothetical protein
MMLSCLPECLLLSVYKSIISMVQQSIPTHASRILSVSFLAAVFSCHPLPTVYNCQKVMLPIEIGAKSCMHATLGRQAKEAGGGGAKSKYIHTLLQVRAKAREDGERETGYGYL